MFSLFYSYIFQGKPFHFPSIEGKWEVFDRGGHPGTPSPGIRLRCAGPPDKIFFVYFLKYVPVVLLDVVDPLVSLQILSS